MAARIITVAQQKGGAGKTTLAVQLAVAWAGGQARVALLDSDPQGSLAAWSQIRETAPKQHADVHLSQVSGWRVSTELDRLKEGFDLVVIDTPPHAETEAKNAIRVADLVVVPVQPSGMDVWATGATTEMARKERTPLLAVLNRVPPRSRLVDTARTMLGDAGIEVATAPVGNRVAFPASMMEGLGVTESEPSGAAAEEILALAAELRRRLK